MQLNAAKNLLQGTTTGRAACRQLHPTTNCQTARRVVAPYRAALFHNKDSGSPTACAAHQLSLSLRGGEADAAIRNPKAA